MRQSRKGRKVGVAQRGIDRLSEIIMSDSTDAFLQLPDALNATLPDDLLARFTSSESDEAQFGPVHRCVNLRQVVALLKLSAEDVAQRSIIAYGVHLAASLAGSGVQRNTALHVLNCVGAAKHIFDAALSHSPTATALTSELLSTAQRLADENPFPPTEWPLASEIPAVVLTAARTHAHAGPWMVLKFAQNGAVSGVRELIVEEVEGLVEE